MPALDNACKVRSLAGMQRIAIALGDPQRIATGDGGKWHLVFPLGATRYRSDFPGGQITFDTSTLRAMAGNFAREGAQRAVNYFHLGQSGLPAPIDSKLAAGWFDAAAFHETEREIDGQKLAPGLSVRIAWTERARGHITKDELRYLSPEFVLSYTNKQTGKDQGPTLLGVALLNDPFLTELPRVAASENPTNEGVQNMKSILAVLGLAENATEAEAVKAVEGLKAQSVKMSESSATALAEVTSKLADASAKLAESEKARSVLLAEKAEAEVKSYVDTQVRAGRLVPAAAPEVLALGIKHGVDSIRFVEKLPVVVKPGEQGIPGNTDADAKRAEASKRFTAKLDELGKTMKFHEAFATAKRELPEEYALHMSAPTKA